MEADRIIDVIQSKETKAWLIRWIIAGLAGCLLAYCIFFMDNHNDVRYVPVKIYSEDMRRSNDTIQAINRHLENLDKNREADHDSLKDIQGDVKTLLRK